MNLFSHIYFLLPHGEVLDERIIVFQPPSNLIYISPNVDCAVFGGLRRDRDFSGKNLVEFEDGLIFGSIDHVNFMSRFASFMSRVDESLAFY